MRTCLSLALLVVSLTACTSERPPAEPGATAPPAASQGTTPTPPAAGTDAPAPTPTPAEPATPPASDPGDSQARFDGYGNLHLGMAAADMEKAWGGELNRLGGAQDPCYFMTPKWVKVPAEFAFMIEDGKFVRYSSERARQVAPGGGRIGMTTAEIGALYKDRIETRPHKYVDGAHYLRIKDAGGGNGVLVFETDPAGKVTEWRVGLPPQVDYVEGCS
ncbi:lectin [Lysobacter niabensis]|uniref:lectin n=1 Tax=Agrilutibacter niabensis TaxID=380628 RepID=UPI003607762A